VCKPRLVVLSYWSPCSSEAAGLRALQIVEAFGNSRDWQVHLITSRTRIINKTNIPAKAHMVEDPLAILDQTYVKTRLCVDSRRRLHIPLLSSIRRVAFALLPDVRLCWSIRAGRMAKSLNPDVLITTGPPMSTHLVGLCCQCRWVADFQDPWFPQAVKSGRPRLLGTYLLRKILISADHITVASPGIVARLENSASMSLGECSVVTLGIPFTPDVGSSATAMVFSLGYFGNIVHRPVDVLLRAFKELVETEGLLTGEACIRFYGTVDRGLVYSIASKLGILEFVQFRERVQNVTSLLQEMERNYALVSIQGQTYGYALSSKLLKYLATTRLVLLFSPKDSQEQILVRKVPGCLWADVAKPADVLAVLKHALRLWRIRKGARYKRDKVLKQLAFSNTLHQWTTIVDRLRDVCLD